MESAAADTEVTESSLPEMINELNSVLVPDEEVARIQESIKLIKEIQGRRQEERKAILQVIQGLEKSVSELRESSTRSSADWRSLEEHTSVMKNMEDEKFDLARKINEQEAALSMLESEIEELRRKSDMLENWDVEEEVVMDKNAYVVETDSSLSLNLFRGIGFLPHYESKQPDALMVSLLVRSTKHNVATSFDIDYDTLKNSPSERCALAMQIWDAAE